MKYLAMLLLPVLSHAATLHVPAEYPTIQAGVTAAVAGDTVLVADGTYTGVGNYNIDLQGKAITITSANGPDECILDAQRMGRLFLVTSGEDTSTVISGFTLRNGTDPSAGGAVYCSASSVSLRNCRFESCSSDSQGGAVWMRRGHLRVSDCAFVKCRTRGRGGAIYADSTTAIIRASQFDSCYMHVNAHTAGGAVCFGESSTALIDSCRFWRNFVWVPMVTWYGQVGGAVACDRGSDLTITATQFLENGVEWTSGGAVYCYQSAVRISDCLFAGNGFGSPPQYSTAPPAGSPADPGAPLSGYANSGGAVYLSYCTPTVERTVFAHNGVTSILGITCAGGAVVAQPGETRFAGCTFVGNFAKAGSAIAYDAGTIRLDSCILAFQTSSSGGQVIGLLSIHEKNFSATCTNSFGNEGGDWVGIMDTLASQYNNFSADPRVCRQSEGNYHLQEDSPCRPEASPCGSLVGALPAEPGCLSCCVAPGNVNHSAIIDGGDLALLVAYLTNSAGSKPPLPCPDEANVNAAGIVDGSDLALLVAYLTNAPEQKPMLPFCP